MHHSDLAGTTEQDPNSIDYWFPRLAATGVKVPRTHILKTQLDLGPLLDGEKVPGFPQLCAQVNAAAQQLGYPVFLRSGHTSAKHEWVGSCRLENAAQISTNIGAIVEYSALADWVGLPTQTWAVREWLPLEAYFTAFRGMPVARERRYFIADGRVTCHHPYWPPEAINGPSDPKWCEILELLNVESEDEVAHLDALSTLVASEMPEAWSLDWARTRYGEWCAIDMAQADRSYHWPACPHAPTRN